MILKCLSDYGFLSNHSDYLVAEELTSDPLKPRGLRTPSLCPPVLPPWHLRSFKFFPMDFSFFVCVFKRSCACLPELYPVLGHRAHKQPRSFCIPLPQPEALTDNPTASALLALGANLCRVCRRILCILRVHWEYSGPMNI